AASARGVARGSRAGGRPDQADQLGRYLSYFALEWCVSCSAGRVGASMAKRIPLAPGLFTWPAAEPALLGGRCGSCGHVAFPYREHCLACGKAEVAQVELPRRGRLWTFTTQR